MNVVWLKKDLRLYDHEPLIDYQERFNQTKELLYSIKKGTHDETQRS
jgi:deoxyribodipyrimidine photolyase